MHITQYTSREILNSPTLLTELRDEYFRIFKEQLHTTCINCIEDGLFRIKYHLRTKDTPMNEVKKCNFRLLSGKVLWVRNLGIHITNDNLTDDLAIALLKLSSGNLKNFDRVPDNLNELLGGGTPKKVEEKVELETAITDVTIDEPVANVEIPTIDTLVKMLRADLIKLVNDYPHPIAFRDSATKADIAQAYINRMILDTKV